MPGTYKVIRLIGTSSEGFSEAAESAVKEAAKTLKGLAWLEVKETRANIKDGKIAEYQAVVDVGFKIIRE